VVRDGITGRSVTRPATSEEAQQAVTEWNARCVTRNVDPPVRVDCWGPAGELRAENYAKGHGRSRAADPDVSVRASSERCSDRPTTSSPGDDGVWPQLKGIFLRRLVVLRWAHGAQAASSIRTASSPPRTPPWINDAQSSSCGHIRRLRGRITIFYVDAGSGDSVRTLAEVIMGLSRELLRAVVT
jgi:hypothetical protein